MRPERVLSADSHITEPPNTYLDYIDSSWKDRAPHLVEHEKLGAMFVIDGMERPVPMGLIAAAGKPAEEIRVMGVHWDALHRGGWDPEARMEDQPRITHRQREAVPRRPYEGRAD